MDIIPLNQHLLVELEEQEKVTGSGIILTGTVRNDICIGIVRQIAFDLQEKRDSLEPGDRVLVHSGIRNKVSLDNKEFSLIKYEDVFGKIKCQEEKQ